MSSPRTLYVETMGCQMNMLDSELVIGQVLARGFQPCADLHAADLVIINTCSVRQHAEDKVWSRLGELKRTRRKRPDQIVAVIGCMAERDGDALLRRVPHVDVLCGPSELNRLPALIDDVLDARRAPHADAPGGNGAPRRAVALSGRLREHSTPARHVPEHDDLEALDSSRAHPAAGGAGHYGAAGPAQAYVRITRGCNKFCSFCVVPMTRGMEQHRPPDQIVAEARRLAARGVREVTLLGQTVNHYTWSDDRGRVTTFADLLRRVHDEVPELPRLRFVTSFPRDFTDDALRAMAGSPRICRYLHIPAQSGSNRLLKAMNRGYTVEDYRDLLDRARSLMPDICLSGDMIVGFPGETEADFTTSVDLLRYARYKNCFIFKYSPRPGTAAYDRFDDDVPDEIKRRRNNDLLAVQAEINLANHRELIGRSVEVLVEGLSKAQLRRQESEQDRGCEVEACPPLPRDASDDQIVQLTGRTSGDQIVVFDGPRSLIGGILPVEVFAATPYTLHGRLTPAGAVEPAPRAPQVETAGSGAFPLRVLNTAS